MFGGGGGSIETNGIFKNPAELAWYLVPMFNAD